MPDINWNGDAASAPYISRYDAVNDNLVLAETNAGTVLLEYDGSQWNATSLDVEQLGAETQSGDVVWASEYADLQTAINTATQEQTIKVGPNTSVTDTTTITKAVTIEGTTPREETGQAGLVLPTSIVLDGQGGRLQQVSLRDFSVSPPAGNGFEMLTSAGTDYFDISLDNFNVIDAPNNSFVFRDMFNCSFRRIRSWNAGNYGILIQSVNQPNMQNMRFEKPWISGSTSDGIRDEFGLNNSKWVNPNTNDCGGHSMIVADTSPNTEIQRPRFEPGAGTAPALSVAGKTEIDNGYISGNNERDNAVEFTGEKAKIDGTQIDTVNAEDLNISGAARTRIGIPNDLGGPSFYSIAGSGFATQPVGDVQFADGGDTFPSGDVAGRRLIDGGFNATIIWDPGAGSSGSAGAWVFDDETGNVARDV